MSISLSDSLMSDSLILAAGYGDPERIVPNEPSWLGAIIVGLLAITASVFILTSARAMFLAPDALSQVNMAGPAINVGLPLLIIANFVHTWDTEGFIVEDAVLSIVAILMLLLLSATGSFVMGRAVHATHWDHSVPLSGGQRAKEPK